MSEVKKIATRDSYGNALVELGKAHDDLIVLDADLAGATKTCIFQKEFPERHWDCGIAECNMTGIAAGLATCGKVPFSRTASHSKRTAIMFQPHFCLLIISFLIWKTYISYLRARLPKAEVPPTFLI